MRTLKACRPSGFRFRKSEKAKLRVNIFLDCQHLIKHDRHEVVSR